MFERNPKSYYSLVLTLLILTLNVKTYAQNTWQQKIDYQINVKLEDDKNFLHGDIKIEYFNNSDKALTEIWMHVFPNAFKNNKSAFAIQKLEDKSTKYQFAKEKDRGYMDSLNFLVNGMKVGVVTDEKFPDILKLILPVNLAPGEKAIISTPFRVKIPYTFSRLGHAEQSYQISQWYPKPAVFDRKGWHPIPYLDQGEFYADYGSFDVKITLPSNYVVGATGELQTASENLFLDSLSKATSLIKEYAKEDDFPPSSKTTKTLHYTQNNIHDFAWFADKRFHVLASEVVLPQTKRKVKTFVMFTNKYAEYWKDASLYINNAVYYYSLWNGDYPYNFCTAIDGALSAGGGMEYPMITVIGEVGNAKTLDRVIAHEVGHNWFYGIIGSNEREHPWMDEGVNSYYENRYMRTRYGEESMLPKSVKNPLTYFFGLDYFPSQYELYLLYQYPASCGKAQPINIHSEQYESLNYAAVVYTKTALVFRYLEQYLGVEKFDSVMHVYFETWKFRHPYPEDMKAVFEKETGENMGWFFDEIINAKDDPSFKIKSAKKINATELQVKVSNVSTVPGPVFVSTLDKKGRIIETQKTAPFLESAFLYFDTKDVKKIVVDPLYIIPEKNRNDNTITLKTPLKKVEPLHLQFLAGVNRPDRTNLYFTPVLGYNKSDGLQPGIALYNNIFPFKNVEWALMPMYGVKSEKLNGTGSVNIYMYPKKFKEVNTTISFSSFSIFNEENNYLSIKYYERFYKYALGTEFTLNQASARSRVKEKLSYRIIHISNVLETSTSDAYSTTTTIDKQPNNYLQLKYEKENSRLFNPYKLSVLYEYANNLLDNSNSISYGGVPFNNNLQHHKILVVYKQKINYKESKKGLNVRLFAGTIFTNTNTSNQSNFFNLSGNNDYTFDKAFFNRYGMFRQQFHELDGAFKSNVFSYNARNMIGMNVKVPAKLKLPIGVFADAAYANEYQQFAESELLLDVGIYFPIINDIFEIYFPIATNYHAFEPDNYKDRIRFILDFQAIQPLNLRRRLQLL